MRDSPAEQLIDNVNKSLIYTYDADGKPKKIKQLIKNHEIVMENDKRIAGKIRYNEFSHQPYLYGSVPWEKTNNCRAWNSSDDSALFSLIQCDYSLNNRQDFFDALKNVAMRHKFHPIKDLLTFLLYVNIVNNKIIIKRYRVKIRENKKFKSLFVMLTTLLT